MDSQCTTRYTNGANVSRFLPMFTMVLLVSVITLQYPPDEIEALFPSVMHAYSIVVRLTITLSSIGIVVCCLSSFSSARLTANSMKPYHLLTLASLAFLCVSAYIKLASTIIVDKHGGLDVFFRIFVVSIFVCLAIGVLIYWLCPDVRVSSVVVSQGGVSTNVSAISEGVEKDAGKEVS